jgi:hypothetical protein
MVTVVGMVLAFMVEDMVHRSRLEGTEPLMPSEGTAVV